jgi:hypothetical protein
MSSDLEKGAVAKEMADSTPTHTNPRVSVPDNENKDEEKSNPSLHSPLDAQAASDDDVQRQETTPAGAVGGDAKPLEKQLSKEVLERSKFATALIMFSLCVSRLGFGLSTLIVVDVRVSCSFRYSKSNTPKNIKLSKDYPDNHHHRPPNNC